MQTSIDGKVGFVQVTFLESQAQLSPWKHCAGGVAGLIRYGKKTELVMVEAGSQYFLEVG